MVKLSFIVPVYNVEQYLRKCVESLIKQDYDSYELILVDDGSTDGSGELCDEIARANEEMSREESLNEPHTLNDGKPQIRVIHQKNGGLSAARNSGLKVAKGEYLCFVDSDDYWEENVLGGLMEQVERENLDVLRFNYQNVRIVNSEELIVNSVDGAKYEVFQPYKQDARLGNDYSTTPIDGLTFLNTRMNYQCYAVMYIMRREIVPTFTEGIHFEDVDWLPRIMMNAKRVASADTIVYNYLVREGSITQVQGNKEKIRKNIEDRLLIVEKYKQYREQYPRCKWLRNMQSRMACGIITQVAQEFYAEREKYIRHIEEMNVFPLSIDNQGRTYSRRARLINTIGPRMYCAIMHLR